MSGFTAVRDGLARRLETLDVFTSVYATTPDRVVAPAAAVIPGGEFAEYHTSAAGVRGATTVYRFDVIVFAGRFDSHHGQTVLDDLVGAMPDVLEADQTLNGAAEIVLVTAGTNYGVVTVADTAYVGCRFVVEVHTR